MDALPIWMPRAVVPSAPPLLKATVPQPKYNDSAALQQR